MAHGFFRVAAATPTVRIADPPRNAEAILKEIEAADPRSGFDRRYLRRSLFSTAAFKRS